MRIRRTFVEFPEEEEQNKLKIIFLYVFILRVITFSYLFITKIGKRQSKKIEKFRGKKTLYNIRKTFLYVYKK